MSHIYIRGRGARVNTRSPPLQPLVTSLSFQTQSEELCPMSQSNDDGKKKALGRHTFLKVGGLGAAAMASSAAAREPVSGDASPAEDQAAGGRAPQGRAGQAPPRRGGSQFTPGMTVHGPHTITFPPKTEWDRYCHDGHGGPPYRMFACGTTPAAAPGGSYVVTMTARARTGTGRVKVTLSCSDWGTKSQYSTLAGSEHDVITHTFGNEYATVTGVYTAPVNDNAWFVQGSLAFESATDVDVSFFSIRRVQETDTADDFSVTLNDKVHGVAGTLRRFEAREFPVNPVDLADAGGVIRLKASIKGNHYGMAQLIYRGPLLMGRNARYRVNAVEGNTFDITLTEKLSGFENTFKMFPFSTKYGGVSVDTVDGAGEHHESQNKNQWLTSDLTTLRRLKIRYPV